MKEGFSLHKRGNAWYVQFKNEDRSYTTAKSTHQTKNGEANTWAINYLKSGQIVVNKKITIKSFAKDFFLYDGPYVRYQLSIGHRAIVWH
jgi:hypothetical protein